VIVKEERHCRARIDENGLDRISARVGLHRSVRARLRP
jgi:hypothetical protein